MEEAKTTATPGAAVQNMQKRTKIAELLKTEPVGAEVTVKGWVKAFRNNQFIALNDGSGPQNLQVVVDFEQLDAALLDRIKFGAAIGVRGTVVESQGKGQKIELKTSGRKSDTIDATIGKLLANS